MKMTFVRRAAPVAASLIFLMAGSLHAAVFSGYSAYHHIRVLDQGGTRVLSFNGSTETKMSLANPLQGHFEYTEFFHMPWLWNQEMERVLMIGLGGGSVQRSYQHYYTNVVVDTVELDPMVVEVAKKFFGVQETAQHRIHTQDGRLFLRRSTNTYDAIIMDAYATTRYGSSIPPQLTTQEFFETVRERLSTNGVFACNVIGQIYGWQGDLIGALCRTLQEVFPHVYVFPATESRNVVLIATRSSEPFDQARVQREGQALIRSGKVRLPNFQARLGRFMTLAPGAFAGSPVLTDARAPVEGLSGRRR
jgi:spermidine synthase